MRGRVWLIGTALALALGLLAGCGSSSKNGSSSNPTSGGGLTVATTASAQSGTTVDVVVSDTAGLNGNMTLTASPATAPAGNVTFTVKNTGTIDHEVVVLKTTTAPDKLPVVGFEGEPNRVDEASSVGETGDPALKPGQSRSFTVKDMAAGSYVLVCNIAKHYGLGMRAPFAVTG